MPSERSMRAAEALYNEKLGPTYFRELEKAADLIDRAAGLPELEACVAKLGARVVELEHKLAGERGATGLALGRERLEFIERIAELEVDDAE